VSKIVDYTILSATSRLALVESVKMWIKDGWQPQGGHVAFNYADYPPEYQQSLVKYDHWQP
jgi:hypothetical protein